MKTFTEIKKIQGYILKVSESFYNKHKDIRVVRIGWKYPPDDKCGRKGEYVMSLFEVPSLAIRNRTEDAVSEIIRKLKAGHHIKLSAWCTIKLYK